MSSFSARRIARIRAILRASNIECFRNSNSKKRLRNVFSRCRHRKSWRSIHSAFERKKNNLP